MIFDVQWQQLPMEILSGSTQHSDEISPNLTKATKWHMHLAKTKTRPRGYKTFSCSTQPSMKFCPLINVEMPTTGGILTFMSRKNSILGGLSVSENAEFLDIFIRMSIRNFMLS